MTNTPGSPTQDFVERLAVYGTAPRRTWLQPLVDQDRWEDYVRKWAAELATESRVVTSPSALAAWRELPWDSDVLGVRAARLDALAMTDSDARELPIVIRGVLDDAARLGVLHLTARVDTADLDAVTSLCRCGFEFTDGLITFVQRVDAANAVVDRNDGVTLREADFADADFIAEIARTVYTTGRFHDDKYLSSSAADRLYAQWARNACLGAAADVVWVAENRDGILGFTTAKVDVGSVEILGFPILTIGLVGVVKSARRLGLARRLSTHAVEWARQNGMQAVEVGTQLRNVPAARAYESAGFRVAGTSLTVRAWLG